MNIFVIGSTKCATTSIFDYFKQAPNVYGAVIKETRFFLPAAYGLWKKYDMVQGVETYNKFFPSCGFGPSDVCLDATPDYMYSLQAIKSIDENFEDYYLIACLRNPVDRFKSWFKFSKQMNLIPNEMTFEEFYEKQDSSGNWQSPQHLRVLDQGLYSKWVIEIREKYGERLLLVDFSKLKDAPKDTMRRLSEKVGMDSGYVDNLDVSASNQTVAVSSGILNKAYLETRRFVNRRLVFFPSVHRYARSARVFADRFYFAFNRRKDTASDKIDDQTLAKLREFYSSEIEWLQKIDKEFI